MTRLDEIVAGLRSADDDAVETAKKALAREAVPEWLPALREHLARGDDPDLRDAAAAAVARLDGANALPVLLAAQRAAEDADDDADSVSALLVGLVEASPEAACPVLRAWLTDADERTRRTAARLWGCGDLPPDAIVAATADPSPAVRAAAVSSCAAYAIPGDPPRAVADAVLARSSDSDAAVRVAAALALAVLPGPAASRRLRELARDPDERVRAVAAAPRAG